MRAALVPFRPRAEDVEHTPDGPVILPANHGSFADGPVVLAANPGSYRDPFFLGIFIERPINYMPAAEFFANPALPRFVSSVGSFPVARGAKDAEALTPAAAVLARGGLVVIYPE